MKKLIGIAALATLTALGGCATSDDQIAKAGDDREDLVCEYTRVTGSNLKKKVCMTPRQREVAREAARQEMENVQRRMAHESAVTGQ